MYLRKTNVTYHKSDQFPPAICLHTLCWFLPLSANSAQAPSKFHVQQEFEQTAQIVGMTSCTLFALAVVLDFGRWCLI